MTPEPIDMSAVGLGTRYSSEDMLRDFTIGSKFSVTRNGVIFTDTVRAVHYSSGSPAIYRTLNRWQRMIRRLTPRRWRKTLLIRAAEPASMTINPSESDSGWTRDRIEALKDGWISDCPIDLPRE